MMLQLISVKDFFFRGIEVTGQEKNKIICHADQEGGQMTLKSSGRKGPGGADWTKSKYLICDLEILVDHRVRFQFQGYASYNDDSGWPDVDIAVSALPHYPVRLCVPLSAFDTKMSRIPRTPGRLLMWVVGKPLDLKNLDTFVIASPPCSESIDFSIANFYLSDEEPEYLYPQKKLLDEMGQWIPKQWPGKMPSVGAANQYLRKIADEAEQYPMQFPEGYSKYGGWKKKQFPKTGFFRTEKSDGRWWLLDPDGYAFLSIGADCVGYSQGTYTSTWEHSLTWLPPKGDVIYQEAWSQQESDCFDYTTANLIRAYGKDWLPKWAKTVRMHMLQWGFNTVGNWSAKEAIPLIKMPYVYPLMDFPGTGNNIYRDFPDVFSKEYQNNCHIFAQQLTEFKDDTYMIGYFMRNEPQWAFEETILICEEMLANPSPFVSKDRFIAKMAEKYDDIHAFNSAWNMDLASFDDLRQPMVRLSSRSRIAYDDLHDFSIEMIREYVRVPADACKGTDNQHLNLGMRWAMIHNEDLLAGSEYLDVFSMNRYAASPVEDIRSFEKHFDMPLLIGEFHFGALDRGLVATGLYGCTNQLERGKAYRYYVEEALAEPACVGLHYFTYCDQSSLGRPKDGENYQIGIVDCCQQPYEEAVQGIVQCNREAYAVAAGEIQPTDEKASYIPCVH